MNYRFPLIFIAATFVLSIQLHGQNSRLDSLWRAFESAKHDTSRVNIYFQIGDFYKIDLPDSAVIFYNKAIEYASGLGINQKPFALRKAKSLREIGIALVAQSKYSKALDILQESIEIYEQNGDRVGQAQSFLSSGNAHFNIGNFSKTLECYYAALQLYEYLGHQAGIADCYNNMGSVHKEQGSYDVALEYHYKSMKIFSELVQSADSAAITGYKRGLSYCYNNIGVAHFYQDSLDEAIDYYTKSLRLKEEIDDKSGMSQSYNNIAIVHCTAGDYTRGIEFFMKSLKIYEEISSQSGLTMVNGNISHLYLLLADSAKTASAINGYLYKSIDFGKKAYSIAEEINSPSWLQEAAGHLKQAYTKLGRFEEALMYADVYIDTQGKLFSTQKTKSLAEMTARYETEKKQLLIESMENENLLYSKRIRSQRIVIISIISGMLLVSGLLIVMIKLLLHNRKANQLLAEQKEAIQQQKEEIMAQLDEIEIQRDKLQLSNKEIEKLYLITLEHKNILENQKNKIDDSIRYAKFIQSAVLPDLDITFVNRTWGTHSYFIMFRPKDVVSGDFYWATRINEWIIVTVADCTGHGVPGAFMSMLGISFLNEIVLKGDIINPSIILSKLRSYIIGALRQTDEWGSHRDGMDMSLISINTKTKECIWAGANNPLWLVRAKNVKQAEGDMKEMVEEIRPNLMPVASHIIMEEFTNHNLSLASGDRMFMFSDGYADQFGGPLGKKFNYHGALKRLIAETSVMPIREQGKELERRFDEWINFNGRHFDQVDDVTVLGIMI
jgi:tetratricopeptide (TPR) repeat protein